MTDEVSRRLCLGLLVARLLVPAVASADGFGCGDANHDGRVTVSDAVQVLRSAAGLTTSCTTASCDADGNGTLTVDDGVNVLLAAAGLPARAQCIPTPVGQCENEGEPCTRTEQCCGASLFCNVDVDLSSSSCGVILEDAKIQADVHNESDVDEVQFQVDYTSDVGTVARCRVADHPDVDIAAQNDAVNGRLSLILGAASRLPSSVRVLCSGTPGFAPLAVGVHAEGQLFLVRGIAVVPTEGTLTLATGILPVP